MPTQQEILQNHLPQIETWIKEYLPEDQQQFSELKEKINHFTIRLPLIGAFSAGKSTVLNALIGKKMLATAIKPETSIPTELSYNNSQRIIVNEGNGKTEEIDLKQLKRQKDLEKFAKKGAWLEVDIDQEHWKAFPHLCLVDFPGLDSGNKIHNLAIDQYLEKSLAYAIVISLKDGDIVETTKQFLDSLSKEEKPVIIILTKADQLSEKDREAVIEKMKASIQKILQNDPLAVIIPDIDNPKDTQQQLVSVLETIEKEKIEPIFRYYVGMPVISFLNNLKDNSIEVLANNANADPEKVKKKIQTLKDEMEFFIRESQEAKETFHNKLRGICIYIKEDIEGALHNNVTRFAELVLDGSNIDLPIEQTVRHQLQKSIYEKYNPLVRDYIQGREKFIPADIRIQAPNLQRPTLSTASKSSTITGDDIAVSLGSIVPMLARFIPAIGKFLGPVGMVISTVLPLATKLFGSLFGESEEEKRIRERNKAYEEIRRKLINQVIPDIADNVSNETQSLLLNSADEIDREFDKIIQDQYDTKMQALEKLQQELAEKEEEMRKKREKYQQDAQAVQELIALLEKS